MNIPRLEEFKDYLSLDASDIQDDEALQQSLDAAAVAQRVVCCYPRDDFGDECLTPDLELALFLRAQRYVARRNSPEGIIGIAGAGGDFVGARVPGYDADVSHLEGPYRKIPVA